MVHLHRHHIPHHHYYHHLTTADNHNIPTRQCSPKAPRASPEASDIDPISSPRRPNFLTIPSHNLSANPSSESLNSVSNIAEALTPAIFKSRQSSPNHLPAVPVSRTSSFNSGYSGKNMPSLPEVLAVHGAKSAALAASNLLLSADYDMNKLQPNNTKGEC